MQVKQFRIGDRVILIKPQGTWVLSHEGSKGTVVFKAGFIVGVEFDDRIGSHDCGGFAMEGHGYWFFTPDVDLSVISDQVTDDFIQAFY